MKHAQHTNNELEVISNVIGKAKKKSKDKEQGSKEIAISAANMRDMPQIPKILKKIISWFCLLWFWSVIKKKVKYWMFHMH